MNTNLEQTSPTSTETTTAEVPQPFMVNTDTPGSLFKVASNPKFQSEQWQDTAAKILRFFILFPDFLNEGFGEYRSPLTKVALILTAVLGVAVADGVLERLNSIPLFAPTFELIGLGATGWFIVRYLLYADTRQELVTLYHQLKAKVTGTSGS
jgi:hypothetical protein